MCRHTVTKSASRASRANKNVTEEETDNRLGDLDVGLDLAFKLMEEKRIEELRKMLWKLFTSKVIPFCSKNLRLDAGSVLEFQEDALESIINDMIRLGESEIYGINGGVIVINFGEDERHLTTGQMSGDASGEGSDQEGPVRLGQLPICTDNIPIYELHLTLIPSTNIKHKMANLFRRFQAKPPTLVVDQKFKLVKKKLYQF